MTQQSKRAFQKLSRYQALTACGTHHVVSKSNIQTKTLPTAAYGSHDLEIEIGSRRRDISRLLPRQRYRIGSKSIGSRNIISDLQWHVVPLMISIRDAILFCAEW